MKNAATSPTILIRFAAGRQTILRKGARLGRPRATSPTTRSARTPAARSGLYEQQTHLLFCPCHQSTFDVIRHCRVTFGPAARALPQLPIYIDKQGYFRAVSDFTEPVGPQFLGAGGD